MFWCGSITLRTEFGGDVRNSGNTNGWSQSDNTTESGSRSSCRPTHVWVRTKIRTHWLAVQSTVDVFQSTSGRNARRRFPSKPTKSKDVARVHNTLLFQEALNFLFCLSSEFWRGLHNARLTVRTILGTSTRRAQRHTRRRGDAPEPLWHCLAQLNSSYSHQQRGARRPTPTSLATTNLYNLQLT